MRPWTCLIWFAILQIPLACGGGDGGEDQPVDPQPSLEWLSPSTAVTLSPGETIELQWQGSDLGDRRVELAFSTAAGAAEPAWQVIADDLGADTDRQSWTVPDQATNDGRWRLRSLDDAVVALSPAGFSIVVDDPPDEPVEPALELIAPNGGETLIAGTTVTVAWQHSGTVANGLRLSWAADGDADAPSWTTLAEDLPATGSYDWTVPEVATSTAVVAIASASDDLRDQSDSFVAIELPEPPVEPDLTLLAPNGGERFFQGATVDLRWQGSDLPADAVVVAEFTDDAAAEPVAWTTIAEDLPASGSSSWTIPSDLSSGDCLVRVRSGDLVDQSDATFRIDPVGFLISQPAAGERYGSGLRTTIRWQSEGIQGTLDLHYTLTASAADPDWIAIASDVPNAGTYDWVVPATPSDDCAIRIAGNSNAVGLVEARSAIFAIDAAGLSLLQPNGGEALLVGDEFEIRWQRAGTAAPVTLAYTTDAEADEPSWVTIATDVADEGSYIWTVPDAASSHCLVRVRDPAAGIDDRSDAVFSISAPQAIRYVDDDAEAGGDGSSWASAFRHPEDALAVAEAGDQLWIAAGTYRPRGDRNHHIAMVSGVGLYGGFAGDETALDQRDWRQQQTVLSGDIGVAGTPTDNSHQVVRLTNVEDVVIDGLVITGGYAQGAFERRSGAGIYCNNAGLRLRNCLLWDNHADPDRSAGGTGGALSHFGSDLEVVNCVFTGNSAPFGAGIALSNAPSRTIRITGTVFSDNHAFWGGGAISCSTNTSFELLSCSLVGNRADDGDQGTGGAISLGGGCTLIAGNSLFAANSAVEDTPLILFSESSEARFAHCQLHDTPASGPAWDEDFGIDEGGNIAAADAGLQNPGTPAGADGIWATADDGLAPAAGSPLIDAGSTAVGGGGSSDLTGATRRVGTIDIGAYEFQLDGAG